MAARRAQARDGAGDVDAWLVGDVEEVRDGRRLNEWTSEEDEAMQNELTRSAKSGCSEIDDEHDGGSKEVGAERDDGHDAIEVEHDGSMRPAGVERVIRNEQTYAKPRLQRKRMSGKEGGERKGAGKTGHYKAGDPGPSKGSGFRGSWAVGNVDEEGEEEEAAREGELGGARPVGSVAEVRSEAATLMENDLMDVQSEMNTQHLWRGSR